VADKLFVDTWGWLTLADSSETHHRAVVAFYQMWLDAEGYFYTTDYVLDETYTLMFKRLNPTVAKRTIDSLLAAFTNPRFHLIWMTPERFVQTQTWRDRYLDKPRISFTDLTSMVVMAELGITQILTGDAHFEQVGHGFQRVP